MEKNDEYYWYWLCNMNGVGNSAIRELLNIFQTPKEIYETSNELLERVTGLSREQIITIQDMKKSSKLYEDFLGLQERGIYFTHPGKEDYPAQLYEIFDAPYALYYKGRLPEKNCPVVSIVGARGCTEYGRNIALQFGREFAHMGIQVVSGMAMGIDAAGHWGALKGNGYTLAVLGCGVDICYPRVNIELYSQILEHGGVISEYPPGAQPMPGQFPMRNRIISGLSDVVIVVEARKKSGSLITIDQALEQNKDIMAVPGRIGDPLSEGCNRLIQMGAQVILNPKDILSNGKVAENYNLLLKKESLEQRKNNNKNIFSCESGLAKQKNMLYSGLNLYPKSLNTIIEETGLTIPEVSALLLELELEGNVREVSKNCYIGIHL